MSARFGLVPFAAVVVLGLTAPTLAAPPAPIAAAVTTPAGSLEEVLAPLTLDRLFTQATVGLQVVNVRTGEEVFARDADRAMIPASTMKVLTAATALKNLGPAYKYTTDFMTDKDVQVGGDGVLKGRLYVQGHGDPTFVVETLWRVVHDLKMEGIREIDGDVVYDEGFLDVNYELPGWDKPADVENGPTYFPSIGALSLNYNSVALVVGPGEGVGKSARVELDTAAPTYVELDNQVVTTIAGSRSSVRIDRELTDDQPPKMKFTLTGTMAADADADHFFRTILDPTAHFMAAFEQMLTDQGIAVKGDHVRGVTPTDADLILQHRSQELSEILMATNKQSNNFMAETVLRTVGAEQFGIPGTTDKGIKAVAEYLGSLGVDKTEYKLVNGSGLSREMLLRPSTLTAVLLDMANNPRVGHEFAASLAIAGQDGTLWRRLSEDPGRLRGKTGTIDGVHCLVGYVEAGDGQMYAFSFLVNDIRGDSSQVKRLHDKFARKMFTVGAPGAEVVASGADDASPAGGVDE